MWTPRRILLLLLTLFAFGGVYAAYARFLGRIDGLPNLPAKYLETDDEALPELRQGESPTLVRLRQAFGENCAEMGAAYPTRLEIRESGIVFAAGMPQIGTEPTKFVRLSPLSVAIFGKPKPLHEQLPGEAAEISTLHSDEGILEFDREVSSDRDMLSGKAKLIAIEMRSNPDPHVTDPRNSRILITNNQRLADPSRGLVVKTPGPLYYRTPDHPEAGNPNLPQVWTNASVEIVNRDNLPRALHGTALPVVAVTNDETLAGIVAEMALGRHTAPPTVTADGMDLYMKKAEKKVKGQGGYAGLREIVLKENVLFSLWLDGSSGFPGSEPKGKKVSLEPSVAAAALLSGLSDGVSTAERLKSKTLLRIRTLGGFRQDVLTNVATFGVAPQANPLLPNNVEVTRYLPLGGKDDLICQRLEIEFNGTVVGGAEPTKTSGFKKMKAIGSHVLISATSEQLQAQGTALTYETDAKTNTTTTTLTGAPLSAVRGRNVLMAGTSGVPSELKLATVDAPAGKHTDIFINGPGRIEMFDETTNEKTLIAVWKKKLIQSRETIDGVPLDRLDFLGDGEFIDAKGDFNLKGDLLKLWMKPGEQNVKESKTTPFRLQSIGHVSGTSADAIIENTDQLLVMFAEMAAVTASGLPPVLPMAEVPPMPAAPVPGRQPQPAAKANPMHMSARKIDVWVNRIPGGKYDLTEARCDDRVVVLQEPNDKLKSAVGVDIRGGTLNMKKRGSGQVMTVNGTPDEIARVRFENTTICGPIVVIDQPANTVNVAGGGWMRMPSSTDLAGAAVKEKAEITIHWGTRMKFLGERRWAEFVGQVQAVQAATEGVPSLAATSTRSSVACHEMNVTFDRPFYFNTSRREKAKDGDPKVETVVCTPASEDDGVKAGSHFVLYLEETLDRVSKKIVKAQQIEAKLLEARLDPTKSVSTVTATGPGVTRMLAMGDKETKPGANPPAKAESEMKLTVVRYSGRLDLKDKKGHYQEAVFREGVRVVQTPTDDLQKKVDETNALPPRSMTLRCNDTFTVSSHRAVAGGEETRTMEAVDGAVVQTDDYRGTGHTINFDGSQVILKGYGDGQATIYRRQVGTESRDYNSGNPLVYNTKTGQVSGAQSTGAQFTAPK